jgi:hypothetical protein
MRPLNKLFKPAVVPGESPSMPSRGIHLLESQQDFTFVPAKKGSSDRSRLLLWVCFLVAVCFAARLSLMSRGLYRDEAWVVTSVLSPSLRSMFYYEKWLQSTPPLFLFLVRAAAKLFGNSEIALRLVPWLGGVLSVVFMGRVLTRFFPTTLAILGTSVVLTNYWALKYSQQVKQYSTDVLVSSMFLLLLSSYLMGRQKRRTFWALVFAGGSSIFLSYPAVFWFPVSVLAIAFAPRNGLDAEVTDSGASLLKSRFADGATILLVYFSCFGLAYKFFIRPNQSVSLTQFWRNEFIGSDGLLSSLMRFFQNVSDLMLPQLFSWSSFISYACGVVIIAGLLRALARYKRSQRARTVFICASAPIVTALVASSLHKYPLLSKPRLIIWMLPICALLLVYAVEPIWNWLTATVGLGFSRLLTATCAATVCVVSIWVSFVVVAQGRSNPIDDFRSGVLYLKNHADQRDPVFVYALGAEELEYYCQRLGWHPQSVYVGDTNLGCCVTGAPAVFGEDLRKAGLAKDVHSFLQGVNRNRAWLLLQSGLHQRLIAEFARSESKAAGCRDVATSSFESTMLVALECVPATAQSGLK